MRLVRRKARRPDSFEKLQLEKVIGLTTVNSNGLACNFTNGDIAYLAGSVVVIYNVLTNCQTRFLMVSRTPKALTCLAYSQPGGKFIAAGESGHQPAVIVWDSSTGSCLVDLKTHKYGISCVQFSPNGKHLVSVGFPHDGLICLWDLKSGMLISKLRATTASLPISGICFASDGSYFVTAGAGHLKYWTIGLHATRLRSGIGMGTLAMDGRNINLGSLRDSSFVSVTSLEDSRDGPNEILPIYALTDTGILCLLHQGLAVKKWVNLKVRQGYGLAISRLHIACACSDGIVRIFMLETLAFAATLPRPAPIGFHGLSDAKISAYLARHNVNGITYPDAVACKFATGDKLAVVYADHSLFIWDVQNFSKIGKCHAFLFHSGCIWDVTNLPTLQKSMAAISTGDSCASETLNRHRAFATCSADGSIRLWRLDSECNGDNLMTQSERLIGKPSNAYDMNILEVLYADKQDESAVKPIIADSEESVDSCKGFRSMSVSVDGNYLAAGDRSGNLHIYDLHSLRTVSFQEAHDAEILALSFGAVAVRVADDCVKKVLLLASGGRDRLVHIYDASRNFDVIETLDDHSASITAVKFACNGSKLLSCSADKSVVFRNIESTSTVLKSTRYHQEMASRGTVFDMDIDPSNKLAVTVGQDKKLNVLNLASGKSVRCFKPEGDAGEPIKVCVDPSGSYIVCSHSDKSMRIYDFTNGDLVSLGQGHAEVITGVTFMPDCKRVISVSGDSCIFVWRLPSILSKMMRKRFISQCDSGTLQKCLQLPDLKATQAEDKNSAVNRTKTSGYEADTANCESVVNTSQLASGATPAFKFSVSRLPHWAQTKVSQTIMENAENELEEKSLQSSDSRWVERLGPEGYKLFSESEVVTPPATIHPSMFGFRRRLTVEGTSANVYDTPESSLESRPSGTSGSSPKVSQRKDTHWKTVHTLFFNEEDYFQDDASSDGQLPMIVADNEETRHEIELIDPQEHSRDLENGRREEQEPQDDRNDDHVVVYLSDDMVEETIPMKCLLSEDMCNDIVKSDKGVTKPRLGTPAPGVYILNNSKERAITIFSPSKNLVIQNSRLDFINEVQVCEQSVSESSKTGDSDAERPRQEEQIMIATGDDLTDDEEDNELFVSPDKDLFSAHFGKLSTAVKVQPGQASTRSSFSTRFFARASHSMPVVSLFQDSPAIDMIQTMNKRLSPTEAGMADGSLLLATEREHLKLQEQKPTGEEDTMDGSPDERQQLKSDFQMQLTGENRKIDTSPDERQQLKSDFIRKIPSEPAAKLFLESQEDANERIISLPSEDHSGELKSKYVSLDAEAKCHRNMVAETDCERSFNCAFMFHESFTNAATQGMGQMLLNSQACSKSLSQQSKSSIVEHERCKAAELIRTSDKVEEASLVTVPLKIGTGVTSNTLHFPTEFPEQQHDSLVSPEHKEDDGVSIHTSADLSIEKMPNAMDKYKNALEDLAQSVDKALNLFRGLESMQSEAVNTSVPNLSSLYQDYVPSTMQKMWLLSDYISSSCQLNNSNAPPCDTSPFHESSNNFFLDQCSLRSSNNGVTGIESRPGTAASLAQTDSMLDSIDIEGFIHRYSVRFSATLASQVLALVQKGLEVSPQ